MRDVWDFLFWFIAFFLPFDWALQVYLYAYNFHSSFLPPLALTVILVALATRRAHGRR